MLRSRINPLTKKFEMYDDAAAPAASPTNTINLAPIDVPPAANANAGGGMLRKPLGAYFEDLEKSRGLPAGFLAKTRAIESTNGTNLVNPNSSARGDFQFIKSTAKKYGINPMDPYQSAQAAADMAAANAKGMAAKGITPDGANLYAAHQQGLSGFLKLASGQSSGGQEMALNGGSGKSPSGFLAMWRSKYDAAKPANLGEGFQYKPPATDNANTGQGPTVAAAAAPPAGGPAQPVVQPPAPEKPYNGGLLGLMQGADYTGAGAEKDLAGKLGDMTAGQGGGQIGTALSGIMKAFSGGDQPQQQERPIVVNPDNVNMPNMQFLELLKRRNTGIL